MSKCNAHFTWEDGYQIDRHVKCTRERGHDGGHAYHPEPPDKAKAYLGKFLLGEGTYEEALSIVKQYNKEVGSVPGAYVIDGWGVMCTDPLHPVK